MLSTARRPVLPQGSGCAFSYESSLITHYGAVWYESGMLCVQAKKSPIAHTRIDAEHQQCGMRLWWFICTDYAYCFTAVS